MCEQILKKAAPQYNSNSLNCKKESALIIVVERLTAAINNVLEKTVQAKNMHEKRYNFTKIAGRLPEKSHNSFVDLQS